MKEKIINFTICLLIFITIFFIFNHNTLIASTILQGINLFFTKVFVSLFPMFIINDFLISLNIPYYFSKIFHNLFSKLFNTSGTCAYVFFMSLISGTPSSAYIIKNLYADHLISLEEANHYLTFTYFSNPLFLITMLSLLFSKTITYKIILIHYLSNFIIGLLLRNKAPKITNHNLTLKTSTLSSTLIKSISNAMTTLLVILGTIIFYLLLFFIISNLLPLNIFLKTIISGILEITNGLNNLLILNVSSKLKEIIATCIISFGGLSINTQVKAILEDTNINFSYFFKGRLYQTLISFILILIF